MRHIDVRSLSLDLATLPGANTSTKRQAAASPDPRFQAMLAEAARVGWPQGFENDLYLHDLAILETHPRQKMIWVLRDNGTNLFPIEAGTPGAAHYQRVVLRYWSGEDRLNYIPELADRPRFYLVGAKGIVRISAVDAVTAIQSTAGVRELADG
jgi:hypothetical protein